MLNVKQGDIKYHFWVFSMTQPGIELRSSGSFANTIIIMPMSGTVKISFTYAENDDGSEVGYPTWQRLRSRLEASRGSSHTEESWYNERVSVD